MIINNDRYSYYLIILNNILLSKTFLDIFSDFQTNDNHIFGKHNFICK